MADLSIDFAGIKSPNPFWLASAPPANTGEQVMRAFDAGWGGAVWKTLGDPIVNVSSRFGGVDYAGGKVMGLNNIELITDRPLEVNLREIREVKRRYPKHAVIASLMTETKDDWHDAHPQGRGHRRATASSSTSAARTACASAAWARAVGQEPKLLERDHALGEGVREDAGAREAHAEHRRHHRGRRRRRCDGGADGVSLINTIKSLIGVDLDRMVPLPRVGDALDQRRLLRPRGEAHRAAHGRRRSRATPRSALPISGIGGISTWRDAAEFIALGSTSVQVCTAVMHYGYRIVDDMIDGLGDYLDQHGMKQRARARRARGARVQGLGRPRPVLQASSRSIDDKTCIGCQLCVVGVQRRRAPVHLHRSRGSRSARRTRTPMAAREPPSRFPIGALAGERVPWIDEPECVGCNLCQLVCPVPGCITMEERPNGKSETWNERVARGAGKVPGGIHD